MYILITYICIYVYTYVHACMCVGMYALRIGEFQQSIPCALIVPSNSETTNMHNNVSKIYKYVHIHIKLSVEESLTFRCTK